MTEKESREALFKLNYEYMKHTKEERKKLYESYNIPKRSTKESAGYDFESLFNFILKPGEIKKFPLGVKANMNSSEVLLIVVRSSQGFKYNVRLCNQVGVIDRDY